MVRSSRSAPSKVVGPGGAGHPRGSTRPAGLGQFPSSETLLKTQLSPMPHGDLHRLPILMERCVPELTRSIEASNAQFNLEPGLFRIRGGIQVRHEPQHHRQDHGARVGIISG